MARYIARVPIEVANAQSTEPKMKIEMATMNSFLRP